jgi:hypothetical protein
MQGPDYYGPPFIRSFIHSIDHCTLRRIVSKNQRTTAAQVTGQQNWIFSWKTLFPQKLSDVSFTNPASTVGLQLLNLKLLKAMLRFVNDGVTIIKSGHHTIGNVCMRWSDELSFTLFPTSGRVYIWRTPKVAYNLECLVPTMKHWGGSMMIWAAILW